MSEALKQAYLDKTTAQLKEWTARVDTMKAQIAQGTAGVRINFHEHVKSWNEKESAIKLKIDEVGTASAERFEAAKAGVQSIWQEMNVLLETLEGKKK
jgi:hypothetical protein